MDAVGQLGLEAYRLRLLRGLDNLLRSHGWLLVAGVDEVGRGCLAGPVVAAAVVVDGDHALPGVDDSKMLSAADRETLAHQIRKTAISWSVGRASATEIDRLNILQATRLAMTRALDSLSVRLDCAVIDAVRLSESDYPVLSLVRGDLVSYSVACASIVAKVERDHLMADLDRVYPHYGFVRHKGYAAAEHRQALSDFGPSPEHRLTFRSVVPQRPEVLH